MDYSDHYDGYDDIYDHSVDDDCYTSPIHRQFINNRENSAHSRHGEVLQMEQYIQEENESVELNMEVKLSDDDKNKLESCLEYVKVSLGSLNMSRQEIVKIIIENNYESDKVINSILNTKSEMNLRRHDEGLRNPKNMSEQMNLGTCVPSVIQNGRIDRLNHKYNIQPISPQSISFLSKIKRKGQTSPNFNNLGNDSKISVFFKKKNLHDDSGTDKKNRQSDFLSKKGRTPDEVGISFSSKIKKLPNMKLASKENSLNSTSSSSSFISKIKNLKVQSEVECNMDEVSKKFSHNLYLGNTNDTNDIVNRKFLNGINVSERIGQSVKDIQMTKTVNVDTNPLKIIEAKSLPTFKKNNKTNHFNIDLTKALQKNNSEVFKIKTKLSTDRFEIPFFPCDDDAQLHNIDEKILNCTLDISNFILKTNLSNEKRISRLGEILCLGYKIPVLKKYHKQHLSRELNKIDKRFNFSTPSPDDKIKKYLKHDL